MADINPFRYRGYYFDSETWFYYLESRYYDPAIGRFINADDYSSLPWEHKANELGKAEFYHTSWAKPLSDAYWMYALLVSSFS